VVARGLATTLLSVGIVGPLHDAAVASDSTGPIAAAPIPVRREASADRPAQPAPKGYTNDAARVSFDPPLAWIQVPATALNPQSDPPDPAQELVRYQLRITDPTLYTLPVPITSALVRDAGAIITVGVARVGGEMIDLDVDPRADRTEVTPVAGFYQVDDEKTFEGLHVFTRYFIARDSDRRIVARAVVAEEDWATLAPIVRATFDSLRADPKGPNAPAAVATPAEVVRPAPAEPAPAEPQSQDASLAIRQSILDKASSMLSTPYVWGGNWAGRGMDCSAYVSAAWGVARYTTESIGWVSSPISKDELRPGDAMNLTIGRDPERFGHIRLFEAWANEAHSLVWVYEETPPRAVHRVVVYDDRYQPIRLEGLSNAGSAALVPAPAPAPERPSFVPTQPRNSWTAPTARPTPRPVYRTPLPVRTPQPYYGPGVPTPQPVIVPTPRPTVRPTPRPTRTPVATPTVRR
jgi:hypothetical protein